MILALFCDRCSSNCKSTCRVALGIDAGLQKSSIRLQPLIILDGKVASIMNFCFLLRLSKIINAASSWPVLQTVDMQPFGENPHFVDRVRFHGISIGLPGHLVPLPSRFYLGRKYD